MPTVKSVVNEANQLSPFERAEVIEKIIESFDTDPDPAVLKAWADESEERIKKYKNGLSETLSEDEVFISLEKQTQK